MKELFKIKKQYTPFLATMQKNLTDLLTKSARSPYASFASAKSEAECGNSNKHMVNSSTPLTRAFFVHSSRTPKERQNKACSSMVACSGQGFALDCFPYVAVFHLVTRYRPTLWKMLAVAPKNQHMELSAMINPTQITGKKRLNSFLFNNNQDVFLPLFPNGKQSTPISAKISENQDLRLTKSSRSPYSFPTVAKSTAGRGNPELHNTANSSTPLTRAIFIRSLHTPKERQNKACSSMVACNGQGSPLAVFGSPFVAVFPPRCTLSPYTVESVADSPLKLTNGLHKMNTYAYSFLCAIRTPETDTYQETIVRIIADSEQNARFQLSADYRLVLPRPIAKIRIRTTSNTIKGGVYA